jgi:UDP-glucose 4-epimerase
LAEQILLHWAGIYKLPVISLRLFNIYGPRSRTSGTYGAVFGVFLAQKLKQKPFTVVGTGRQTRDFTFVTDVVNAFILAAESSCQNEVLNVGSGNTYSINYLVELLGGPVTYIPKRPGEPECTLADITKIKNVLGWQPKVSFEAGVKTMLDNINYWQEAPLWTKENIEEATRDWFRYLAK